MNKTCLSLRSRKYLNDIKIDQPQNKDHREKPQNEILFMLIRKLQIQVLLIFSFSLPINIVTSQSYSSPVISIEDMDIRFYNFPDLVSGTQSGYRVCSNGCTGDGIFSPTAQYHKVKRGVLTEFDVQFDLQQGVYEIDIIYISEYGTHAETRENIGGTFVSLFFPETLDIPAEFVSPKGSLGDIIRIEVFDQTFQKRGYIEIPVVSEGIIDNEVATQGRFLVPQTPQMVLHDPPGDKSYTSFTSSDSYCKIEKNVIANADGKGGTATIQRGFSGSGGPVVAELNIEATLAVTGTFKYESARISEDEYETCITTTSEKFTSKELIGRAADLFIGYGIEYEYGTYDLVEVVGNKFVINSGLVVVPDQNTMTEFFYTTQDIETDIELQRSIFQNPAKTIKEREIAFNQINVWQKIIDRNDDILNNQPYDETPINWTSSSGGATLAIKLDTIKTTTNSSEVVLDGGLEITATALFAGNGLYGGPKFTWTKTTTFDTTEINGSSHTITRHLEDDDDFFPDNFQTLVGTDPDYGTPIFKLKPTSQTSCPYEGGKRRDRPRIYVADGNNNCPVVYKDNIPVGTDVVIEVTICNDNPTENRTFDLYLENNINTAIISFGGQTLINQNYAQLGILGSFGGPDPFCRTIPLIIEKNDNFSVYNDLRFYLYPSCLSGDPLPIPTILNEGAMLNVSITFGGPGNYPTDDDCDGIPNAQDACPNITNVNDFDCDGTVNEEDPCPFDASNSDSDNDQIKDCNDFCPTVINGALNFDRAVPGPDNLGDYIDVSHHPDLNLPQNDFTIACWIYPTDGFYKTIVSKGHGFNASTLYILGIWDEGTNSAIPEFNGKLGLYMSGVWKTSQSVILQDTWTHIAVSFKKASQTAEFYINGNLDITHTFTNTLNSTDNQSMYISRQGRASNFHGFKGSIDELSLWNQSLTAVDIGALKKGSLTGNEVNLAAYYKFNDYEPCLPGGPTSITDSGPNNLTGTLENFSMALNNGVLPCESNWSTGRNEDSDGDGIGDDCQIISCIGIDSDSDGYSDCVDKCPNSNDTALNFGASGTAFISASQNYDFTDGTFSISAWVNPHVNALGAILTKANVIDLFIDSNTGDDRTCKLGLRLEPNLSSVETQFALSTIPTNSWSHIAVTFSQGEATFYINGIVDQKVNFEPHSFNTNPFTSGVLFGGNRFTIDDLTAWDSSLSEIEINAIMNAPLKGDESDLLVYYDFNGEIPCGSDQTKTTVQSRKIGGDNANLQGFSFDGSCQSNWTYSHNFDSNNDGVGNSCNTDLYQCSINTIDLDGDGLQDCLDLCPTTANIGLDFRDSDGVNDIKNVVNVAHNQNLNLVDGNFTLSAWIKHEGNNDNPILVKGDSFSPLYYLYISREQNIIPQHESRIGLYINYPDGGEFRYSRSKVPKHKWTHVAITFSKIKNEVRFFINGIIDGVPQPYPTSALSNSNTDPLYIGNLGDTGRNFEGVMDEIMIWDRNLSASELRSYIENPVDVTQVNNLVAFYKFDNGTICGNNTANTTLLDYSNNGYHGTLDGFDLTSCFSNWTTGRNTDFDNDGQGDECDDGINCVPNYAGIRSLDGSINIVGDYETNGIIESTQLINDPGNIDYDSGTAINLLPGFEVRQSSVFEAFIDGCGGAN